MREAAPTFSVDLEPLLAPVSPDAPAGPSLRYDDVYDRIREARRQEDATLPQGVWQAPVKAADWDAVSTMAAEALRQSKDLRIAGWLIEAWTVLHQLAGLDAGLQLLSGLIERFWETAHPELDASDPVARLAPFEWIDDKVAAQLRGVALTRPEGSSHAPQTLSDWDVRPGQATTAVRQAQLMSGASMTPPAHFAALRADLARASARVAALELQIAERMPEEPVSFPRLKQTLGKMQALLGRLDGKGAAVTAAPDEAIAGEPEPRAPRPIQSRAEAYQRLIEGADYLMRTEPHSPTPYLVKRAVAWGDLPLAKLLRELVNTPQDLKAIFALLGIKETE
jgi:type VI secretion system protein ImpA